MTEGAGGRIAVGLAIAAALVGLAMLVDRSADDGQGAAADTASGPPSSLQFCVAWQQLASTSDVDRAGGSTSPDRVREALTSLRDLGQPTGMSTDARAGLAAALDGIEAGIDPSFEPTAVPAAPEADTAFSAYLQETCPG